MKRNWFAALLALMMLLSLAACGGKDTPETPSPEVTEEDPVPETTAPQVTEPVQTGESEALSALRREIGGDAVLGVAYLGYAENAGYEAICAYLEESGHCEVFPVLREIPRERTVLQEGGELYLVVPASAETELTVSACVLDETDYTLQPAEVLVQAEDGQPVLLRGNISDILPNLMLTAAGVEYAPSLSLENGALLQEEGIQDLSDYELLAALWAAGAEPPAEDVMPPEDFEDFQPPRDSFHGVTAALLEETGLMEGDYDWVIVDDTLPMNAAFTALDTLAAFRVWSLQLEDVDEAGVPVFSMTELYDHGALAAGNTLVVTSTVYGSIPSYAVSFVGADGVERFYGLGLSGMDGSLELTEI